MTHNTKIHAIGKFVIHRLKNKVDCTISSPTSLPTMPLHYVDLSAGTYLQAYQLPRVPCKLSLRGRFHAGASPAKKEHQQCSIKIQGTPNVYLFPYDQDYVLLRFQQNERIVHKLQRIPCQREHH